MWQSYILKRKGYSIFEQVHMTAEERRWIIDKIEEENEQMKQLGSGSNFQL